MTTTLDDSHSEFEVILPNGVKEDEVSVTVAFCDRNGQPDPMIQPIVVQEKKASSRPQKERRRSENGAAPTMAEPAAESL